MVWSWYDRLIQWSNEYSAQIKRTGIGMVVYQFFTITYNWTVYPFIVAQYKGLLGSCLGIGGSLAINAIFFYLYDRMKSDWLGAQAIHELESNGFKNRLKVFVVSMGNEASSYREEVTHAIWFMTFSLIDPFITAVYFQRQHFQGLGLRDWRILLTSTAIGNLWYLSRAWVIAGGIISVKFILRLLF